MDRRVALTVGFAAVRIGYAAALIASPRAAGAPWLGSVVEQGGGRVAARALVARDALISAGVASAALKGLPTRPWLAACVASDFADIAATLADRQQLPEHAALGTTLLAGAGAAIGASLFAAAEE